MARNLSSRSLKKTLVMSSNEFFAPLEKILILFGISGQQQNWVLVQLENNYCQKQLFTVLQSFENVFSVRSSQSPFNATHPDCFKFSLHFQNFSFFDCFEMKHFIFGSQRKTFYILFCFAKKEKKRVFLNQTMKFSSDD